MARLIWGEGRNPSWLYSCRLHRSNCCSSLQKRKWGFGRRDRWPWVAGASLAAGCRPGVAALRGCWLAAMAGGWLGSGPRVLGGPRADGSAPAPCRIEQLYQKVMALWHQLHMNTKSLISWNYLRKDIALVQSFSMEKVRWGLLCWLWGGVARCPGFFAWLRRKGSVPGETGDSEVGEVKGLCTLSRGKA